MSKAIERHEFRPVVLAFAAFFLLLSGYYILRPVRDAMGVATGANRLHWLFTGTFVATLLCVPIFGWVARTIPRRYLLVAVYAFIVANLAGFFVAFQIGTTLITAVAFFIWLSVVNLFLISIFWSNVSDVFNTPQAKRLYGYIAAGGTAGAMAGPALTAALAAQVPTAVLIAISATLLSASATCSFLLRRHVTETRPDVEPDVRPIGGSILAGIRLTLSSPTLGAMALLIIFYTTVSTVLYVEQADVVGKTFSSAGERTAFFATIDLIVNGTALLLQIVATRAIVRRYGLRITLALVPFLITIGLLCAGMWRTAILLAAVQIIHRAGDVSLGRPGREMIYTTVDAESRYKAKSFIDTTIYRSNDALSSWLIAAVRARADAILLVGVPAALLWLLTGYRLGRRHDRDQPA